MNNCDVFVTRSVREQVRPRASVSKQIMPAAAAALGTPGLDFDQVIGDSRQTDLYFARLGA